MAAKGETKPVVSDETIRYLREIEAEGVRLAHAGAYSLNAAMKNVDARRAAAATTAQSSANPPRTA